MRLTLERLEEIKAALAVFNQHTSDYVAARVPGAVKLSFRGGWNSEWAEPVRQLVLNDLREKIRAAVGVLDGLGFDVATLNTESALDE